MIKKILNLRNVIVITICLASNVTMLAQDVIVLRNGTDIQAIVQEVGLYDVRFIRFDNPEGPIHTIRKSDILMIMYENGTHQVFNEVVIATANVQQLPALTHSFGRPINPHGSERSPALAGFLSFLAPGVGQFYNGDNTAGWLFLGSYVLCNIVWMTSARTVTHHTIWGTYQETTFNGGQFLIGFLGATTVNIWSIIHASRGARNVNIARGFRLADNTYLQIQPALIQSNDLATNQKLNYGMSFRLNF